MVKNTSETNCKLFVGGLSHDTTDSTLLTYFESFGKVISAIVLRDPETLSSRGFGFVSFASRKEALNCLSYGNAIIDNKEVEVKMAKPRPTYLNNESSETSTRHSSNNNNKPNSNNIKVSNDISNLNNHPESDFIQSKVFVGGLLYSTGAESLKDYFLNYGDIISAEIIYNKETKISRGFGFVEFKSLSSAIEVIKYQKEVERHKIDGKKVEVKRCLKKSDNQQQQSIITTNDIKINKQEEVIKKSTVASVSLEKTTTASKTFSFAEVAKVGIRQEKLKKSDINLISSDINSRDRSEFDFLTQFDEFELTQVDEINKEELFNKSIDTNIWTSNTIETKEFNNDFGLFETQSSSFLDNSLFRENIDESNVEGKKKITRTNHSINRDSEPHYLDSNYTWKY